MGIRERKGKNKRSMNVRSGKSFGRAIDASFSSNFSPGAVLMTLSRSSCDKAARLATSTMRTSALNSAKTTCQTLRGTVKKAGGQHSSPGL